MTVITKTIGRLPVNLGEYDNTRSYGRKNRVIQYTCELESKVDNNTYPPFTWDGAETFTLDDVHWTLISGNPMNYILQQAKPATTGTTGDYPYNGMGRVVLKKNMINNVNTLTQDMFYKGEPGSRVPNANTIFVIRYDYVLGEDITMPSRCILEFDGGSISISGDNNTITSNDTIIKGSGSCNCIINGSFNCDNVGILGIKPENTAAENSANIERILSGENVTPVYTISSLANVQTVTLKFGNGTYNFYSSIDIEKSVNLSGLNSETTVLNFTQGDGIRLKEGSRLCTFRDFSIVSSDNCFDLSVDGCYFSHCLFENLVVKAPNGAGFCATVNEHANGYSNTFKNIKFFNCKYCLNNVSLTLGTVFYNCYDLKCEIFFKNCYFYYASFYGGNCGFGETLKHFIYNDAPATGHSDMYSLFVYNCNFEALRSNAVVAKNTTTNQPQLDLWFYNCEFHYAVQNYLPNNCYVFKSDYSDLEETGYSSKYSFFPIIGINVIPHLFECKGATRDNDGVEESPILASVSIGGNVTALKDMHDTVILRYYEAAKSQYHIIPYFSKDTVKHSDVNKANLYYPFNTYDDWGKKLILLYQGASIVKVSSLVYYNDLDSGFDVRIYDRNFSIPSGKSIKVEAIKSELVHVDFNYVTSTNVLLSSSYLPVGTSFFDASEKILSVLDENKDWKDAYGRTRGNLSAETAGRPTNLNDTRDIGYMFFDKTIGEPIWWNGSGWVDATGATV